MSFTAGSMSDEIGSGHFGPFVTVAANSACTVYAKEEGAVTVHDKIDEECESLRDSEIFPLTAATKIKKPLMTVTPLLNLTLR